MDNYRKKNGIKQNINATGKLDIRICLVELNNIPENREIVK